jgi:hypothetical protein
VRPDDAAVLFMVISMGAGSAALAFAVAWRQSRRRVRELERYFFQRPAAEEMTHSESASDERLALLAERVEQLAEGQDFLARLLTTQRERPLPAAELPRGDTPRLITPH